MDKIPTSVSVPMPPLLHQYTAFHFHVQCLLTLHTVLTCSQLCGKAIDSKVQVQCNKPSFEWPHQLAKLSTSCPWCPNVFSVVWWIVAFLKSQVISLIFLLQLCMTGCCMTESHHRGETQSQKCQVMSCYLVLQACLVTRACLHVLLVLPVPLHGFSTTSTQSTQRSVGVSSYQPPNQLLQHN